MSAIDALLGKVFNRGTNVDLAGGLDFQKPLKAVRDDNANIIRVGVDPIDMATLANGCDELAETSDATPVTVATITLDTNTIYDFGIYMQAFGTTTSTWWVYAAGDMWQRLTGAPTRIGVVAPFRDDRAAALAGVVGVELAASGNNLIVRWTGKASTNLAARIQVGYAKRAIELASA